MIDQLASLILAIDALLGHTDFNPHANTSASLTSLFRNMWFLCVLFGFTSNEMRDNSAMNWLKPALSHIALKTPPIILEEAPDAVTSDVEYNSAIRQEYAHTVCRLIAGPRTRTRTHISFRLFRSIELLCSNTFRYGPATSNHSPMDKSFSS
jgi:phosphatidylinositol 4-kinase A